MSEKSLFEKAKELALRHENEKPCERGQATKPDGTQYIIEGEECPFGGYVPTEKWNEKSGKMVEFPYYRMCDKCVAVSTLQKERTIEEVRAAVNKVIRLS